MNTEDISMTEIDKIITDYEEQNKISFNLTQPSDDELKYLNLSLEEIGHMSLETISGAIYILNRYALYIQRIINSNRAYDRWATAKIDETAASYIPEIQGMNVGWSERMLICKNTPPLCKKLNKFLRIIRMKNDRIQDLPSAIHRIADSFRDIKYSKIARQKNEN